MERRRLRRSGSTIQSQSAGSDEPLPGFRAGLLRPTSFTVTASRKRADPLDGVLSTGIVFSAHCAVFKVRPALNRPATLNGPSAVSVWSAVSGETPPWRRDPALYRPAARPSTRALGAVSSRGAAAVADDRASRRNRHPSPVTPSAQRVGPFPLRGHCQLRRTRANRRLPTCTTAPSSRSRSTGASASSIRAPSRRTAP